MSKMWVNGAEIDLATLTPEELSALTNSDNLDYIKPNGMYYSESISGDGSFDKPFGVSKLNNPLIVSIYGESGNTETKIYDGSETTILSLDDYRSIADQNTIDGNGTLKSPFKVSDNLLTAIDSAYSMSIQTAKLIDGLEDTIESVLDYQDEVSAKCNSAIAIAQSAMGESLIARIIANSAVSIAQSAMTEVDKLYDFVSTLIYNIEYDDKTNSLILTYVDGTTSNVYINDITKLENNVSDLSAYCDFISGRVDQIMLDLKNVVVDIRYRKSDYTLIIVFIDGSVKEISLDVLKEIKNTLRIISDIVSANTEDINNLTYNFSAYSSITNDILESYSGDITNIYSSITYIQSIVYNIYNTVAENTENIDILSSVTEEIVNQLPSAVTSIDYDTTEESGLISNYLTYKEIDGTEFEFELTGIDDAINDIREKMLSCVTQVSYDDNQRILSVVYGNGEEKEYLIGISDISGTTTPIYFTINEGAHSDTITINGEEMKILAEPSPYPIFVTGNSVNLDIDPNSDVTSIDLNGQILDSDSNIDGIDSLTAISNVILPSNGAEMFVNNPNLQIVDVNSDLLINGENMFKECSSLTTFNGNLKTLIIAPYMFYDCSSLVDFSTDMPMLREANYMFYNCEELDTLNNLNLKRLEDGTAMFADCNKLASVVGIQLDKLTNGSMMFSGSHQMATDSIKTPKLENGDYMYKGTSFQNYTVSVDNLQSAQSMFADNTSLKSFKVNKLFDLTLANSMFEGCTNLMIISADGSSFSSTTEANKMFFNCGKLKGISNKWNFNTLEKASAMFYGCTSLTEFNIETPNLRDGSDMFNGCVSITGISANVKSLTVASGMFEGCTALTEVKLDGIGCSLDLSDTAINSDSVEFIADEAQDVTKTHPTIIFPHSIPEDPYVKLELKGWNIQYAE